MFTLSIQTPFPLKIGWHFIQIVSLASVMHIVFPKETVCMEYQTLFYGKKEKISSNLFSAELAQSAKNLKTLKFVKKTSEVLLLLLLILSLQLK